MAIKQIIHPTTGQTLFMGRNRPEVVMRAKLNLRNYLNLSTLPTPPPSADYSKLAMPSLRNIYLNATYGCCVVAGSMHAEGIFTGNAGGPCLTFTDPNVETVYSAWGGFDPNNPTATDDGCDEETAWTKWQQNGLIGGKNKIQGWIHINAAKVSEYTAAGWLFESLMYGVELPDEWVNPAPSGDGFVWDVAGDPDEDNGHCFCSFGYNSDGSTKIDSWAMFGTVTAAANAKYATNGAAGSLYAILSQDSLNKATGKAPNGVDWEALVAAANALGGHLSLP